MNLSRKPMMVIYPKAKVADSPNGLVLYPSPPHVPFSSAPKQRRLPL